MNRIRNLSAAKRIAIVAALLGVLATTAGLALASGNVPTPTITAAPANPTSSATAGFSFTDSQQNVTFLCSLDGSAYTSCKSPQSYAGLAEGTHTFAVEAQNQNGTGSPSSPASYTWRIDRTPPAITIAFPLSGRSYNGAGWTAGGCSPTGVCGSATDSSGVAAVAVSILQSSTGKYWNGSSFSAASETWNTATLSGGTSTSANWAYPLSLPSSDGGYTLHVRATDKVGNQTPLTSPAGSAFTIDTVPPPAPGVSSSESSPTGATSDTFTLSDTETGVTYQCQLDGGSYSACSTPKSYSGLGVGTHTFSAEALDAAGNVSKATQFSWQIVTVVPFGIAGAVPNPLYPGAPAQRIPLTLSNPMNVPITVTGLTVTVQSTNAAGCSAAWYSVTQSNLSSTQALTVPAGATAFAVPAANQPSLQMVDSHTLQDACKGARLTLSYTGSAHS